ncbi:LysR family transcriptional regulator [Desulfoluna butyratoxydans]|uniref:Transcription regulator hth lysr n=1 Tax=Desulfoluna butyratoxydans TaxID=231438 RepID=A0A4U8YH67_9BACT|nr:LysR family transcriptional regulator [Desulfoluna butyratoxydans]VFQ42494.1 transcription regulator hth lysr [Desulfoluna butyratoxydans]
MDIRHFRTLKAIVEQGSFINAARALNYAQSSITSHVKAIEDYYDQPVFDRIGKRVVLNAFGAEVYRHALVLLVGYEDICNLKNDTDEPSGSIRIGVPESTMLYRLSPVLQRYKSQYPKVEIIMQNALCPVMRRFLKEGDLDLGLLLEQDVPEPELAKKLLLKEPMSIVLPRQYPADDLVSSERHVILYTEKGCNYRKVFQRLLEEKGIQTDNVIETASVEVIKKYVLCDIGVSFLPTIVIKDELARGELKHVPWESDDPVELKIAYHKDKWLTPAMKEFIRFVSAEAAQWQNA